MTRTRLPNRRFTMSWEFEATSQLGAKTPIHFSVSEDASGRLSEIWIDVSRDGTFHKDSFKSLALAASLAMQHGATLGDLKHSMKYIESDPDILGQIFELIGECYSNQLRRK